MTTKSVQIAPIREIALSELKPVATNPRLHSKANVAKIARSIETFGWTTPILITDQLEVIAGHGRILAAQQLGITAVPCIPCWYAVRKGSTAHWQGDRTQSTVWEINNLDVPYGEAEDTTEGHSTQKPAECMRRPILNHTVSGDTCYDPFMGSGTTLIAAESTHRVAYGCEIEPAYVDMAVRRWEAFSGSVARLSGDGRTFAEIAKWRVTQKTE